MNCDRKLLILAAAAGLIAGSVSAGPALADDLYDFGEYLSNECTTCHQLSGKDQGIPSVTGWPVESFVLVMQAYKEGERNNTLMQTVARRFRDEDLQALAVFFGKQ